MQSARCTGYLLVIRHSSHKSSVMFTRRFRFTFRSTSRRDVGYRDRISRRRRSMMRLARTRSAPRTPAALRAAAAAPVQFAGRRLVSTGHQTAAARGRDPSASASRAHPHSAAASARRRARRHCGGSSFPPAFRGGHVLLPLLRVVLGDQVGGVEHDARAGRERLERRRVHVPHDELPRALAAHDPFVAAGRCVRVSIGNRKSTHCILRSQ